jgi:pyruvate/2-oxoglutarate dehydrogenase complex dihydrolipoamide acyltransferase (E2) component
MPVPVHTPRINNNDDFVRVAHVYVSPGSFLSRGDPLADLETDKATFTLEAERDGYLLCLKAEIGETVAVGSILAWVGDSAEEAPPAEPSPGASAAAGGGDREPTLKAALLLARYGLAAAEVPAAGQRLTAGDIERYVASRPVPGPQLVIPRGDRPMAPSEPGRQVELTRPERGMLRTVSWQKEAVPAYLEIVYDPRPWDEYAADFQRRHRLFMSPLLALLAWRLARIAAEQPAINATLAGERKHVYDHVNLGFTVQSGPSLYAVVVREAESMEMLAFVQKLGELQRSAMRGALRPEDVSGATIGFSSMARWGVTRHVPVLLPESALMAAHAAPEGGTAALGATYDHRLLHGADAVRVLQALASPPGKE